MNNFFRKAFVASALVAAASAASAATYTQVSSLTGATSLISGSSFVGVSVDTAGWVSSINGVVTGLDSNGIFTDSVTSYNLSTGGNHSSTTFTFDQAVTAFGADVAVDYRNNPIGSGLNVFVDIGSDGNVDFTLDTTARGFAGFTSDSAFNSVTISVQNNGILLRDGVYHSLETYQATNLVAVAAAVPEPETYALMLAGLGAVGFIARRKRAN